MWAANFEDPGLGVAPGGHFQGNRGSTLLSKGEGGPGCGPEQRSLHWAEQLGV